MKKKIWILPLFCTLFLMSCSAEEELSSHSVVDSNAIKRKKTALSDWIMEHYTTPYGIEVNYRWEKNTAPSGTYNIPASAEKVQAVLETLKALWIDLYTHKEIGGADFFKGKRPLAIHLYGGSHKDINGVEVLSNDQGTALEMHIYHVNDFEPTDPAKVYLLMRSVHHQFAKRLMELYPYDRDAFRTISALRYTFSTKFMVSLIGTITSDFYGLSEYANTRGFYTLHSFLSPEDDFAEIISSSLLHTPKEVAQAEKRAQTPDYDSDPVVQERYNREAEQAHREFVAKREFITNYFQKEVKIPLARLQTLSVKKMRAYLLPKK